MSAAGSVGLAVGGPMAAEERVMWADIRPSEERKRKWCPEKANAILLQSE
jgi:hypothetical protein